MNLNMIRPRNRTEDLLLSITKNCETLIKQTHKKAEETMEFKMIKPRKTIHCNPPVQVKEDWMFGLTDLEVYNSFVNITEQNNKIKLYKFPDSKLGVVSYENVRDENEKELDLPNTTDTDLQDDIIASIIVENIENK